MPDNNASDIIAEPVHPGDPEPEPEIKAGPTPKRSSKRYTSETFRATTWGRTEPDWRISATAYMINFMNRHGLKNTLQMIGEICQANHQPNNSTWIRNASFQIEETEDVRKEW